MKRISILKGVVGSLGISMLFGMASCTDDHFDIRVSDPAATGTIWQRIEAEPETESAGPKLDKNQKEI